jgi:WD40 repeat protein
LKGLDGANPRLAVNWYSRRTTRILRVYQVVLRGVRNEGVRVVAPRNSDWFATIPVAVRGSGVKPKISLWNNRNGKRLPAHFPPLRLGRTSAFCSSDVLGWVDGGDKVHIAKLGEKPLMLTSVKQMVISQESLRSAAISPDGKRLLLCARKNKYFPGRIKMILAPSSGAGTMKSVQYLKTGDVTCSPVFSPNSRLAAFALVWVNGRVFGGMDIFLVRVHGFRVLRWADIHAVMLPQALSFSPDGRQLALTTPHKIFIFDIPGSRRSTSQIALPLSHVKQIRMP